MRLIDADALIAKCMENANEEWNKKVTPVSWAYAEEDFADRVADAPTIYAVPVAECKKCAEKTYDCIVKLQEQIEQLARERNAALEDLKQYAYCPVCNHFKVETSDEPCKSCKNNHGTVNNWEWRGVQDES